MKIFLNIILSFLCILCLSPLQADAALIQKSATTTTGLIGWWMFDEGTSTIAGDFSINRNRGVLRNGSLWASGKRGRSINFDGNNDYVEVPSSTALTYTGGNITFSAWINPDTGESSGSHIFSKPWNGNGEYNYRFAYNSDQTVSVILTGATSFAYTTTRLIPRNQWSLVTITISTAGAINIYYNGQLVHTTSHAIVSWVPPSGNGSVPLCIGSLYPYGEGWGGNTGFSFQGRIDDARIYNQVLTATEVSALYRLGETVRKVADKTGLVGYWPMDEATSTTVGDFSGRSYTGTLSGSPVPTWVNGKKGMALSFDNNRNYVETNQVTAFNMGTQNFTLAAFVKKNNSTTRVIYEKRGSGLLGYLFVLDYPSVGQTAIFLNDPIGGQDVYAFSSPGSMPVGAWFHAAVTVNRVNNTATFYNNGIAMQTVSIVATTGSIDGDGTLKIGYDHGGFSFNGSMDDARIYSRALSGDEVALIAKSNQTKVNAPQDTKLTSGLVGYWTFNGKNVSGSTALDVSGQNNHGTFANTQNIIGKVGQGMVFNGVSSLMTLSSSISLAGGAWTIASWFKYPMGPSGSWNTLTRGVVADHQVIVAADGQLGTYDNGGGGFVTSGYNMSTLAPNAGWHHLTAVGSGSITSFYIDGVLVGSSAYKSSTQITYIGNCSSGCGQQFGTIDELRIYNRAFSAAEANRLYLMGK